MKGKQFKLGRRRRANVQRARREKDGDLTSTIHNPQHKLHTRQRQEEAAAADTAAAAQASAKQASKPTAKRQRAGSFDDEESRKEKKGDAYSKLLSMLPAASGSTYARALRARLAQAQGHDNVDDDDDGSDGSEEEEDDDVEVIRARGGNDEDDDTEDEDDEESDGSDDDSDAEKEEEEGDGDEEEEAGDAPIDRDAPEPKSDSEGNSEGEGEDEDEDDAGSDSNAEGAEEPHDPFQARYVLSRPKDSDADALASAAKQALHYAPMAGFAVPCGLFGAGHLDSGETLTASASASVDTAHLSTLLGPANAVREMVSSSNPAASSFSGNGSSSAGGRSSVITRLDPPSLDLQGESSVVSKVAAAWNATYGGETRAIALRRAKWAARLAKRSGDVSLAAAGAGAGAQQQYPLSPLQYALWSPLSRYNDVYFAARTATNARELRTLSALHVANHVVKARELVQRHDLTLKRLAAEARAARIARRVAKSVGSAASSGAIAGSSGKTGKKKLLLDDDEADDEDEVAPAAAGAAAAKKSGPGADSNINSKNGAGSKPGRKLLDDSEDEAADGATAAGDGGNSKASAAAVAGGAGGEGAETEYRDQGFTRPRVLVLLPLRHSALQFVRSLLRLLAHGGGRQIANRNRFFREFSEEDSGLGE